MLDPICMVSSLFLIPTSLYSISIIPYLNFSHLTLCFFFERELIVMAYYAYIYKQAQLQGARLIIRTKII